MGLGAYEVDVYYEAVKKQLHTIQKKLKKIREKRVLHRERRAELGFSSISLAGYTNAGKSSLFKALTDEEVPIDESLFTTLSTTTRLVKFSKKKFLLTDTVGFIDRLPLTLIAAFRSTLEETIYSDLILLVVDISEPINLIERKLDVSLETIEQIGASGIPTITALNKIDLLTPEEINQKFEILKEKTPRSIPISALHKTNIEMLKQEILKTLGNYVRATIIIPMTNETMPFLSLLHQRTDVQTIEYHGDHAKIIFESTPSFAEKIRNRIKELDGNFEKS